MFLQPRCPSLLWLRPRFKRLSMKLMATSPLSTTSSSEQISCSCKQPLMAPHVSTTVSARSSLTAFRICSTKISSIASPRLLTIPKGECPRTLTETNLSKTPYSKHRRSYVVFLRKRSAVAARIEKRWLKK